MYVDKVDAEDEEAKMRSTTWIFNLLVSLHSSHSFVYVHLVSSWQRKGQKMQLKEQLKQKYKQSFTSRWIRCVFITVFIT